MMVSLRPLIPPAALISAAAIFDPSATPRPTKAAGPVMMLTSPILISASVTPGSAAQAAEEPSRAAASMVKAVLIVSSLCSPGDQYASGQLLQYLRASRQKPISPSG